MKLPLELATRDLTLNAAAEADLRERVERLDRFYDGIMRCRVTVEGPGPHHRQGTHRVRIDLRVPGTEIVVNHQHGPDLAVALREAFDAATRRLEDYVRKTRGFVKRHAP